MTKCFDAKEPNGWEVRLEGETEIELSATLISEQYGSITQSNKKKTQFLFNNASADNVHVPKLFFLAKIF